MKGQNGITLVALIITIIVMLILVGVTVSIVIESGLIGVTENSVNSYEKAVENEKTMGQQITVNGQKVNITDY